jgi:aryl-alcohol dehydrogenase-like predicted oxidoreductase
VRFTTLGRTGLRVSVAGLGCGGPSRLGQAYGASKAESIHVVHRALDLGINIVDTAEAYRTEEIVGEALAEANRQEVVISTKKGVWDWQKKQLCTPQEFLEGIEASLRRLRTEAIDLFHFHGLAADHVDYAVSEIVPVIRLAQSQGKIRFLAASEVFNADRTHLMLPRAIAAECFDVVMVGFNLLNPSARHSVLPETRRLGIGTLVMFAVRRALSDPERLEDLLAQLHADGSIPGDVHAASLLALLGDIRDAAYRFCVHEPGVDVVLTGTGKPDHLEQNVRSLTAPPLSLEHRDRLRALFGHIDHVTAQ